MCEACGTGDGNGACVYGCGDKGDRHRDGGGLSPVVSSEIQSWFCDEDEDPIELLLRIGIPELAGMTGVVLGAASGGAAVVLDDLSTSAAALVAIRAARK